jgi:aspartyl-tRNA(Asn)/glutamyl-tRNA(Gln) amidotransferase subunit A
VRGLAQAFQRGETSPSRFLERSLEAVARDPRAFLQVDAEGARRAAAESEQRMASGRALSPLDGVPVSIKDLFDIRGQVTAAGSTQLRNAPVATQDAPVVAALRSAGAVIVGRTHMSEYAFTGLGDNPHFPRCFNPADAGHVPGGSSSGAAVSVALGQSVVGLGTDTGGSVRIPASFCGLVGFKPTQARVSRDGAFALSVTQDSIGPLAHSVACCVLVDQVISGTPLEALAPVPLRGLRFAVPLDFVLGDMAARVASAFEESLARLSAAGARIERVRFPHFLELPEIFSRGTIVNAEAHRHHARLGLLAQRDMYDPMVLARIDIGGRMSDEDLARLFEHRARMIALTAAISAGYDGLLLPTTPITAPAYDHLVDAPSFGRLNALALRNTSVFNFLDRCAISLPMPVQGGLPCGLMIVGEHMQDRRLLEIAASVEVALAV